MKNKLLIMLALAFAGCTAAEAATKDDCCMALNQGSIWASGINTVLRAPNDPLPVTKTGGAVKYIHIVDSDGNTIAPQYVEGGLQLPDGAISGAKFTLVSSTEFAALKTQVESLSTAVETLTTAMDSLLAVVTNDGSNTRIKNPQGDVVLVAGQFSGAPTLKFYQDSAPVPQTSVSASSPSLALDTANALQNYGLVVVDP